MNEVTQGSEKQIAWASQIKADRFAAHTAALALDVAAGHDALRISYDQDAADLVAAAEKVQDLYRPALVTRGPGVAQRNAKRQKLAELAAAADEELAEISDAVFWIDYRDSSIATLSRRIATYRMANPAAPLAEAVVLRPY